LIENNGFELLPIDKRYILEQEQVDRRPCGHVKKGTKDPVKDYFSIFP
jgi:hypothetical protein